MAVTAEAGRDSMIELQGQRLWSRSERENRGFHMKRDEVDSSSSAEQMVCTQLRKNGLYDVGYRVRRKKKETEAKKKIL